MEKGEVCGKLIIRSESHLHGRLIVQHAFPTVFESLMRVLGGVEIPLRPMKPFSRDRRSEPKRQAIGPRASRRFMMMPVDQGALNSRLKQAFKREGWRGEPPADPKFIEGTGALNLRGDFVREKVFVEVEFGNSSSTYRDLFKFQVASRSRVGEVAILLVATERLARRFDSNVATFEGALKLLPYMAIGLQMPVWILGIEPRDFASIKVHYESMMRLCEENGVACASFEESELAEQDVAGDDEDASE